MPSFLQTVRNVVVDFAFGGMWYVIVKAGQLGLEIKPENGKRLASIGEMIKVCIEYEYLTSPMTISRFQPVSSAQCTTPPLPILVLIF